VNPYSSITFNFDRALSFLSFNSSSSIVNNRSFFNTFINLPLFAGVYSINPALSKVFKVLCILSLLVFVFSQNFSTSSSISWSIFS